MELKPIASGTTTEGVEESDLLPTFFFPLPGTLAALPAARRKEVRSKGVRTIGRGSGQREARATTIGREDTRVVATPRRKMVGIALWTATRGFFVARIKKLPRLLSFISTRNGGRFYSAEVRTVVNKVSLHRTSLRYLSAKCEEVQQSCTKRVNIAEFVPAAHISYELRASVGTTTVITSSQGFVSGFTTLDLEVVSFRC